MNMRGAECGATDVGELLVGPCMAGSPVEMNSPLGVWCCGGGLVVGEEKEAALLRLHEQQQQQQQQQQRPWVCVNHSPPTPPPPPPLAPPAASPHLPVQPRSTSPMPPPPLPPSPPLRLSLPPPSQPAMPLPQTLPSAGPLVLACLCVTCLVFGWRRRSRAKRDYGAPASADGARQRARGRPTLKHVRITSKDALDHSHGRRARVPREEEDIGIAAAAQYDDPDL